MRLPAVELLKVPFLATESLMDLNHEPSQMPNLIPKLFGQIRSIDFTFYLDSATPISIDGEMVVQLDLSNEYMTVIAVLIDNLIEKLVPNWKASSRTLSTEGISSTGDSSTLMNDDTSLWCSWHSVQISLFSYLMESFVEGSR
ncbi:hypothetical protein TorRG33x02_313880 [Trema orientale]|uniref:Uncharacterized protein n=1 Tax=Trema orientale TaxID=63057 RepID=A0A2P5BP71_TREOI|nr:hypothetical protein TorRG33x02_313880 [Trema orientale]